MSGQQEVVLLRHGETDWSRTGKHTGLTDVPLTEDGRREAGLIARALAGQDFALVLSSPRKRALDTCKIAGFGERAHVRQELAEWDYGEYERRTTPEIREELAGWTIWSGGAPGGETADQVGARIDAVIEEIRSTDGDVLIFGHGHSLRVLAARWLGLAPTDGRLFALDPATLSVLGYERETPVIRRWNLPPVAV